MARQAPSGGIGISQCAIARSGRRCRAMERRAPRLAQHMNARQCNAEAPVRVCLVERSATLEEASRGRAPQHPQRWAGMPALPAGPDLPCAICGSIDLAAGGTASTAWSRRRSSRSPHTARARPARGPDPRGRTRCEHPAAPARGPLPARPGRRAAQMHTCAAAGYKNPQSRPTAPAGDQGTGIHRQPKPALPRVGPLLSIGHLLGHRLFLFHHAYLKQPDHIHGLHRRSYSPESGRADGSGHDRAPWRGNGACGLRPAACG